MSKNISPEHLSLMSAATIARDNLRDVIIDLGSLESNEEFPTIYREFIAGVRQNVVYEINRLRMALKGRG